MSKFFMKFTQFNFIRIQHAHSLNDNILQIIAQNNPNLTLLYIAGHNTCTAQGLTLLLINCEHLSSVELFEIEITNTELYNMFNRHMPNLIKLSIFNGQYFPSKMFISIIAQNPQLNTMFCKMNENIERNVKEYLSGDFSRSKRLCYGLV